ncbi:hypothetical protein PVA44_06095 [Entomospira nematocerorum]|uniref:Uncharacterized protein n=1 Tax=Entomospira nematocerorum TaxID=2719987 RepID=A0A968GAV0_9SPIO|nr:hypothetical protein [Entomospira nematocera]NIZ46409.1 hypothetical protein [Entomospira nematocera]WDI33787.1 hypothetical protein PVA44_06095 [Entomospira nematocera]
MDNKKKSVVEVFHENYEIENVPVSKESHDEGDKYASRAIGKGVVGGILGALAIGVIASAVHDVTKSARSHGNRIVSKK